MIIENPTEAVLRARALGIPDELFLGLCEWIETHPIESEKYTLRYSTDTRAHALAWCKHLVEWRKIMGR